MLNPPPERTWQVRQTSLEVDLERLRRNFVKLREEAAPAELMPVLKSDAYGHSHHVIAETLESMPDHRGLHGFGVANVEEGVELRRCKIRSPVYVLSGIQSIDEEIYRCLKTCSLTPVISSLRVLREFDSFLRRKQLPQSFHLKFNTGMNRLGLELSETQEAIRIIQRNPLLRLEGLLSHYSAADKPRQALTRAQTKAFRGLVAEFAAAGLQPKYLHTANSAALLNHCYPEGNVARVGYELYTGSARWTAQVYQVRELKKGEAVGYGPSFRAPRRMRIAVLGVGYSDGYPRALSNRASVLIHGRRCKVIGNISMDLTMVDVSKVPQANEKSRAVLMGVDGRDEITPYELAKHAKTIPWEVLTGISPRVPRVFLNG